MLTDIACIKTIFNTDYSSDNDDDDNKDNNNLKNINMPYHDNCHKYCADVVSY